MGLEEKQIGYNGEVSQRADKEIGNQFGRIEEAANKPTSQTSSQQARNPLRRTISGGHIPHKKCGASSSCQHSPQRRRSVCGGV